MDLMEAHHGMTSTTAVLQLSVHSWTPQAVVVEDCSADGCGLPMRCARVPLARPVIWFGMNTHRSVHPYPSCLGPVCLPQGEKSLRLEALLVDPDTVRHGVASSAGSRIPALLG
jgi:hypothetical protein